MRNKALGKREECLTLEVSGKLEIRNREWVAQQWNDQTLKPILALESWILE